MSSFIWFRNLLLSGGGKKNFSFSRFIGEKHFPMLMALIKYRRAGEL